MLKLFAYSGSRSVERRLAYAEDASKCIQIRDEDLGARLVWLRRRNHPSLVNLLISSRTLLSTGLVAAKVIDKCLINVKSLVFRKFGKKLFEKL